MRTVTGEGHSRPRGERDREPDRAEATWTNAPGLLDGVGPRARSSLTVSGHDDYSGAMSPRFPRPGLVAAASAAVLAARGGRRDQAGARESWR
ncbi:hypothetical protein D3105_34220, partial [Streptomyces globisporus]